MGHPKLLEDTKGNISSEEKAIRVDAREELFKQQPLINITPLTGWRQALEVNGIVSYQH